MGNAWEIPVSDCSRDTRDSVYTDPTYNSQLKIAINEMFVEFIRIENVIHVFHKYNLRVLTEEDKEKITITDGDRERSRELLTRLAMYENWFNCLLDVLEDENVKLTHVASAFRNKRDDLNEKWLQEPEIEQDDCQVLKKEDRAPSSLIKENQRLKIKLEKEEGSHTQEKKLYKKCEEQLNNLKSDQATINKIRMEEKNNLETKLKLLKQDYEHEKKVRTETEAKMMEGVSKNDVSQSLEKLRQESEKLRRDYDNERESREDLESKIKVAEAEKLEMKHALEQEHQEKLDALKKDEKNALRGLKDEIRLLTSQLENVRKECDLKRKSCDDFEAKTKIIEAEKSEIKQALEKEYQEKLEIKQALEKECQGKLEIKQALEKECQEKLEIKQALEKECQGKLEIKQALEKECQGKLEIKQALEKECQEKLEIKQALEKECQEKLEIKQALEKECQGKLEIKQALEKEYQEKLEIKQALEKEYQEKLEIKQALEKEYQEKIEILKIDNEKEKTAHEQLKMKHLEIEAEQLEMRQSLEKKHQVILEALQNDYIIAMEDQKTEIKVLRSQLNAINKEHEEDKKAHEKLEELERVISAEFFQKTFEHGKRGKTQGLESFKSNDVSEFSNKFQKISFLTIPMHEVIKIKENINVLLIGNTGSGKSATGNSVLRRQVFKSVLSSMPVTTNISSETYTFDDRVITVFDGPGFEDPSEEAPVSEEYFIKAMKQANAVNASGYHAFIIVFSAMRKADASDMNLIRLVKKYFGEDFLRKFCVIVMTGGDLLNDTLFSHWCSENTGSNEIILECGKAVLFDNKTKDQSRLELQFKCLISLIDNLNQSDEELITFPDSITQAL